MRLSEEILGVDPWYYWTDHEPSPRREIEVPSNLDEQFSPPTFRYRGWFINDEDLLNGFAPDPLRENVYSLEMLDHICETLLRLRGNMIVPGTFLFPDERSWEVASRRGLALNMDHVEIVGLNTVRWPANVPFSYAMHPDIMERYWRDCIAAFKGREVVWTVGYRGKQDRPFWKDELGLDTPAARGALMTKAIARQVELIRQADPHGAIVSNLWSEGGGMVRQGVLKLPEGVVRVWSDDGTGIIYDHGAARAGDGIYYHTMVFSGWQNHLSEMVNPGRICGQIGRFAKAGATGYFLVNISNVRAAPLSTDCAMRLVWNAGPYLGRTDQQNMDAFLVDWSRREFGATAAQEIAAIYARYFNIPYQQQNPLHGENYAPDALRKLDREAAPLVAAGKPLTQDLLANVEKARQIAAANRAYVADLAAAAAALLPRVPDERRDFYQAHVLTQINLHLHGLEMLEDYIAALGAYNKGNRKEAIASAQQALGGAEELCDAQHRAETGKWAAWYFGERFEGLDASRDRLRVLLAKLRGEPPPPIRPGLYYPDIYQYQDRFLKNYPRMYPHKDADEDGTP